MKKSGWQMLRRCPVVVWWPGDFAPPDIGSVVVFPSTARKYIHWLERAEKTLEVVP